MLLEFPACRKCKVTSCTSTKRVAAVDKIEDQRKPEDFIGHRNRAPVLLSAKVGKLTYKLNHLILTALLL